MPVPAYLEIISEVQGSIEGSCTREARENTIEILSFDHEIQLPRSGSAVYPAGRPVHEPIKIMKLVDKSTPKLYQTLLQRERLSEVKFSWYRFNHVGSEEVFFNIRLENAVISGIRPCMPLVGNEAIDQQQLSESIEFCYEKIIWGWGDQGDIEYEDTWIPPGHKP